jgi:hypothetical protein
MFLCTASIAGEDAGVNEGINDKCFHDWCASFRKWLRSNTKREIGIKRRLPPFGIALVNLFDVMAGF